MKNIVSKGGQLQNEVPVCKSKCQVWRIFEKLNSANTRILRMTGTYKCKLEFTKPNKLHTCDSYDRMVTDQTPVPENGHTNRR